MNKMQLLDQTILQIKDTSTEFEIVIQLSTIDEIASTYRLFTQENLSEYKILNDSDIISAIYVNKKLSSVSNIIETEEGVEMTIKLSDVDSTELRIKALESKIDELINSKTE